MRISQELVLSTKVPGRVGWGIPADINLGNTQRFDSALQALPSAFSSSPILCASNREPGTLTPGSISRCLESRSHREKNHSQTRFSDLDPQLPRRIRKQHTQVCRQGQNSLRSVELSEIELRTPT